MSSESISRRNLIVTGGLAVASVATPVLAWSQGAPPEDVPDEAILIAALAMEEQTIRTYERICDLQILRPDDQTFAKKITRNHEAHADSLRKWLREFGSLPSPSESQSIPQVRSANDALRLLVEAETTAMDTYLTHAASLYYPEVLADAVRILVDEVKHHTVLSAQLAARTA